MSRSDPEIPSLLPRPAEVRRLGTDLVLSSPVLVYAVLIPEVMPVLETFVSETAPASGIPVRLVDHEPGPGDPPGLAVEMHRSSIPVDSYHLFVNDSGAVVRASSPSGLLFGLHTWLQLCDARPDGVALPRIEIMDRPRFIWRGMHLDVSRHFYSVAFVKKYIDLLARHKMNVFHWHLCDDQGWRIEIASHPRLTEVGAWRTESDGRRYGGFYTQTEIRDVIDYARRRCITVVPEIEMPGHAMSALSAYPEYSCTGGPFAVPNTWGVFEDVYCAGNERTFAFLEHVLTEVAAMFPGPLIHIGGDECPKDRWRVHALCQDRMRREGLAGEDRLQSYFIGRIAAHLKSLEKRLIGWDEILDGGAPVGAAIMAWRGAHKGTEAARAGHDVIMCPMSHCYFDHYQASPESEPKAIGGFTPLRKVYEFEPVPDDLPAESHRRIIGGQGNVWSEYMPDSNHVEYMTFPRLCALAEVLWSPREGRAFEDFTARLAVHLNRLARLNVRYRPVSE